jgi:filamentous hemagglutinin
MSTTISAGIWIDLNQHEAAGGHTIALHVGKTEIELRARLTSDPTIPGASSFTDLATAEKAVNAVVQANLTTFMTWLSGHMALCSFDHDTGSVIGQGLARDGTGAIFGPSPMTRARVIVRKIGANPFFVLTSFPVV